jgi:Fe-S cluster assembly protein SufB
MDNIVTYVRPNTKMKGSWDEVPEEIKSAFDKLGIPKAEHEYLAGVGAQYDSTGLPQPSGFCGKAGRHLFRSGKRDDGPYADMVREYFMKLVPRRITNSPPCTERYGRAAPSSMCRRGSSWMSRFSPTSV